MMRETHLEQQVRQYRNNHVRLKLWQRFVAVLGCVSIFCTTYAMILPAITMTNNDVVNCGMIEHRHTDECYAEQVELRYACEEALHRHTAECYNEWGQCVCGYADYYIHTHDESCFNESGDLICPLPEVAEHVHDESCFGTEAVYLCGETESGHTHGEDCYIRETVLTCEESTEPLHTHGEDCYTGELTCTTEENHVHTEDCYAQVLICEDTDPAHEHTDDCFASVPVCEVEEGHIHGPECYASVLTCTESDAPAHEHTEDCYETAEVMVCGLEESEGHGHTEECTAYEAVLACPYEKPEYDRYVTEAAYHRHTADCFDEDGELICGHVEILRHQHDSCAHEETVTVLVCVLPEHEHDMGCFPLNADESSGDFLCGYRYEHEHNAECYNDGVLICNLIAHTHTAACRPADPEADLETAEDWERSFAGVELTTNWAADVVRIAESQLGYTESTRNFELREDGTTKGVSRYGQWYGYPYADWDAMFVSFCLSYAGVNARTVPQDADAGNWENLLRTAGFGSYRAAGSYDPKPGDLIFFDYDGDGEADRAGIVYDILPATGESAGKLYVIEGDREDAVSIAMYDGDAPSVLAFCEMPENPDETQPMVSLAAVSEDGTEVVVTGYLPEGAKLTVKPMELSEEELTAYLGEERAADVSEHAVYDICILTRDGAEWQPDGSVSVVIRQGKLRPEEDETVSVLHLDTETGEADELGATVTEEQDICFETSGFSPFIVLVEPGPATLMATSHLPSVITGDISMRTSYLYNIDYSGSAMAPLAGVTYTVYTLSGEVVGTATTTTDDGYALSLESLTAPGGGTVSLTNGTEYYVAQTGVPEGYVAMPQTMKFKMTSAGAAVGMFFDYLADSFTPDKVAQVSDYDERVYGVTISATSGKYDCTPSTTDITLVLDRSGSMLFPADLVPLEKDGEPVKVRFYLDDNSSSHPNLKKNSQNLTDALGKNASELYYVVADVEQTATVYAIWYDSSINDWYYQDVSSYARAYQGVSGFSFPSNNGWQGDSSIYGGVISKSEQKDHFRTDINNSGLTDPKQNYSMYYDYQIYTAGEYNRLTYLKDAVNQLVSQLVSLKGPGDTINVSLVTFCSSTTGEGTYSLSTEQGISNFRSKLGNITTSGGTRHDLALEYVYNNSNTYAKKNSTIVLISDGAITDSSQAAQNRLTNNAKALKKLPARLITVGLSLGNVEAGKTLLQSIASTENGKPLAFYVENTSELVNLLLEEVLSRVIRKDKETQNAAVRDYISDSFYPIDPATNQPLTSGTKIALDGSIVKGTTTKPYGTLLYDEDVDKWYVEWSDQTLPLADDGGWAGTIYVRAREDFVGGNAIETNYRATISMTDPDLELELDCPFDLETPTVNVGLLGMNEWTATQTIFVGDEDREDIIPKADAIGHLQEMFGKIEFQKLDDAPDHSDTTDKPGSSTGVDDDSFTLAYAGIQLTDDDWALLSKCDKTVVTKQYTYDNESSNGPVGEFQIWAEKKITPASGTTPEKDEYTLHVKFVPYTTSTTGDNQRDACEHNGTGSPGAEAKGDGQKLTGDLVSDNKLTMNRLTGTISVNKEITAKMKINQPQTFTFGLYQRMTEDEAAKLVTAGTITSDEIIEEDDGKVRVPVKQNGANWVESVTVPANSTAGSAYFTGLPRGEYVVKELLDETAEFAVKTVTVEEIPDEESGEDLSCDSELDEGDKFVTFLVGYDKNGNDVIDWTDIDWTKSPAVYSSEKSKAARDGIAGFLNAPKVYTAELNVEKRWVGKAPQNGEAVYVVLCLKSGDDCLPVLDKSEDDSGIAKVLKLTAASGWAGKFTVEVEEKDADPIQEGYLIRELNGVEASQIGGYQKALVVNAGSEDSPVYIWYSDQTGTVEEGGWLKLGGSAYVANYGTDTKDSKMVLTVTNRTGGELPATGGGGSGWLLGIGAGLLGVALVGWVTWRVGGNIRFRKKKTE